MHDISFDAWSGAPVDLFMSVNPIYTDLRRGLVKYRQRWGRPPADRDSLGSVAEGGRERRARRHASPARVGLGGGDSFDATLAAAVKEFQAVHRQG